MRPVKDFPFLVETIEVDKLEGKLQVEPGFGYVQAYKPGIVLALGNTSFLLGRDGIHLDPMNTAPYPKSCEWERDEREAILQAINQHLFSWFSKWANPYIWIELLLYKEGELPLEDATNLPNNIGRPAPGAGVRRQLSILYAYLGEYKLAVHWLKRFMESAPMFAHEEWAQAMLKDLEKGQFKHMSLAETFPEHFGEGPETTPESLPHMRLEEVAAKGTLQEVIKSLGSELERGRNEGYAVCLLVGVEAPEISQSREMAEAIKFGKEFSYNSWARERRREEPEFYEAPSGTWCPESEGGECLEGLIGEEFGSNDVRILRVHGAEQWLLPAIMEFGGINENPEPGVHVGMAQKWANEFSAHPLVFGENWLVYRVFNPPTTRGDARKLAKQQFLYCPDIVHQGVESLDALASTLLRSPYWYFWWD